jgi:hypothetical protein
MLPAQKQQVIETTIKKIQSLRSSYEAATMFGNEQSMPRAKSISDMLQIEQQFLIELQKTEQKA